MGSAIQRVRSALRLTSKRPMHIASSQPLGNTESPEDYRLGGLYPIKLSQVLNERYQVLRKLGHGRYATVWLAKDQSRLSYTALKVSVPIDVTPDPELSALSKLNEEGTNTHACFPVPKLLDAFVLEGPSGKHTVLVLELLGGTFRQMLDDIEYHDWYGVESRPMGVLREIMRKMVEAVEFTHSRRIVHRDIQLKNFLLRLRQSPGAAVERLLQQPATILPPDAFGMKHFGSFGPPYIVEPELLETVISARRLQADFEVALADFGAAASFENANDGYHTYPLDVRSPEQLLGLPISEKADIWALGCTMFHFVTLRRLFNINGYASSEERDDQHLQGMLEVLGLQLPEHMIAKWSRRNAYISDRGELLPMRLHNPLNQCLNRQVIGDMPDGVSNLEATRFEDFVRFIMRLDPQERPGAKEILKHPWLLKGA